MGYGLRSYSPTSLPALRVAGDVTATRFLGGAGTVAAPTFSYESDPDNGDYLAVANTPARSAGGTVVDYAQSATLVTQAGASVNGAFTTAGVRNATPSSTQNITAVGQAITAGTADYFAIISSDGNYTLTATPTIADGFDGQEILLLNVGANTVTIQDQGTLASSNLRLTGASVAIGPRDSVRLVYSTTVGDWVQVGALVAVV